MRWLGVILGLLFLVSPAYAETSLRGDFTQGGLVFGKTEPGSIVELDGRKLRVSSNGNFIFGFTRDFGPEATLKVTDANGNIDLRTLKIDKRNYKVQRINGLPKKMVSPPASTLKRIRREISEIKAARAFDTEATHFLDGFIWPARGKITGVYGSQRILNHKPRRPHFGIDIAAPKGTPVVAPAAGIVRLAVTDHYYTGGTIILDHGHGLSSAFLHMDKVTVKVGDELAKGAPLGTIGSTGRSTGPHLDWRINWFEQRLDPALLVPPMN